MKRSRLNHTGGNTARQQVVELDDWTVRILRVLFAGDDRHALTAKHEAVVLALQQHQDVLQQNDVQLYLLRATQTPRQRTLVQHRMLSQIQLLRTRHNTVLDKTQRHTHAYSISCTHHMGAMYSRA